MSKALVEKYDMEEKKLLMYFGFLVSPNKLRYMCNALVSFEFDMQNLHFSMRWYADNFYRLDLPYENIRQIDLHRSQEQDSKKQILIQLKGGPKIYELQKLHGWVRTTDFTSRSCISQASAILLLDPSELSVPDFIKNLGNYSEHEGSSVAVESGSCYSSKTNKLAPVVDPPPGFDLPFHIVFKVNALVQNARLPGTSLDTSFYELLDPTTHDRAFIDYALQKLLGARECCYDPVIWLSQEYSKWEKPTPSTLEDEGDEGNEVNSFHICRVQVTPTRVYFSGPELSDSNRVLRNYLEHTDNFIIVSFVDENLKNLYSKDLLCPSSSKKKKTKVYDRIHSVLNDGVVIGNKKFEFLAFSTSQFRKASTWMFAPSDGITAAGIRSWMGDFESIKNVAKYAARLGQSFSSSIETLDVKGDEMEHIPDVTLGTRYVFSDGIGKISPQFAQEVATKCGLEVTPAAFQIRYGGYKGVVAQDPNSSKKLSLRNSMRKFHSDHTKLDVLAWSRYLPCYLNRQLITLLSTLGVSDSVFEGKQKEAVDPLKTLDLMPLRENTKLLKDLITAGFEPSKERSISAMLQYIRESRFQELRTKTRIFVPLGRSMLGCLDETGTLEYGQVAVRYSEPMSPENVLSVTGAVVVAKSPCLHPGDIRVLSAIEVPALYHMVDCIVFPQKGKRPHPDECSGSDLDGDLYFVSWDPLLIPPQRCDPMDYTRKPVDETTLPCVTVPKITEFFTDYAMDNSVGIIANAHTVFADREQKRALSTPCIELAHLFSTAVDFSKTGVAPEIPARLYVKEYPDFMGKLGKPTYKSKTVIGKLFRELKKPDPPSISSECSTHLTYDKSLELPGTHDHIPLASFHKENYNSKLQHLMDRFGIKTEAELVSRGMGMSEPFNENGERIEKEFQLLKEEALSWFNANEEFNSSDQVELQKASAWYQVTNNPTLGGDQFWSFPLCVYDRLIKIKAKAAEVERRHDTFCN